MAVFREREAVINEKRPLTISCTCNSEDNEAADEEGVDASASHQDHTKADHRGDSVEEMTLKMTAVWRTSIVRIMLKT
jgi:hypothetical protein